MQAKIGTVPFLFAFKVDVHISGLRKKIDNGFPKKLIETVHCVGYRLKDE